MSNLEGILKAVGVLGVLLFFIWVGVGSDCGGNTGEFLCSNSFAPEAEPGCISGDEEHDLNGGDPAHPPVTPPPTPEELQKVKQIIFLMQENHSFDNYFGVLGYVPNGPYHPGPCLKNDHRCVDGLACSTGKSGALTCSDFNLKLNGEKLSSFRDPFYCVRPDLDHNWEPSHQECNFDDPNNSLRGKMDGFQRVNEKVFQNEDTMGYYNQDDLPYYYALAQTFAISDRAFSSLIGPTIPNRMYSLAATSFGHVVTDDEIDHIPSGGYKPITGSLFDLLDQNNVSWVDYYDPGAPGSNDPGRPYGQLFRPVAPPKFKTMDQFYKDTADGNLPAVAFIDLKEDEHPPKDIRAGQFEVAKVITAIRNSPHWKDSIIFLTYDEHGGFYDHVTPPDAVSPDNIPPGRCADRSNPPTSEILGNGVNCEPSKKEADSLCSKVKPGESCAGFNQLGIRVPFIAISPFSKPHYVSHRVIDHTSILAFIEKRFLNKQPLTERDRTAKSVEGLFDFKNAPSLNANVPQSLAPEPQPTDPNCGSL